MATDKPRYSITLEPEIFEKIENFRFANRYQTRGKATVELIRLGLEAYEKENRGAAKPDERISIHAPKGALSAKTALKCIYLHSEAVLAGLKTFRRHRKTCHTTAFTLDVG